MFLQVWPLLAEDCRERSEISLSVCLAELKTFYSLSQQVKAGTHFSPLCCKNNTKQTVFTSTVLRLGKNQHSLNVFIQCVYIYDCEALLPRCFCLVYCVSLVSLYFRRDHFMIINTLKNSQKHRKYGHHRGSIPWFGLYNYDTFIFYLCLYNDMSWSLRQPVSQNSFLQQLFRKHVWLSLRSLDSVSVFWAFFGFRARFSSCAGQSIKHVLLIFFYTHSLLQILSFSSLFLLG